MRGERRLLRLGECLVRQACRRLPQEIREEHYREWAAELPAILHDPQVRPAPWRAVRMLVYAADTLRGTALTPGWARGPRSRLSVAGDLLFWVAALALVAFNSWLVAQAPGDWQEYLLPAWSVLFVAYLIRKRVHPAGRMTALLCTSSTLTLVAWNAAQGNWLNYVCAALVFIPLPILLLAWWLRVAMPARGRHALRDSG
jgi:hypothetical protein